MLDKATIDRAKELIEKSRYLEDNGTTSEVLANRDRMEAIIKSEGLRFELQNSMCIWIAPSGKYVSQAWLAERATRGALQYLIRESESQ